MTISIGLGVEVARGLTGEPSSASCMDPSSQSRSAFAQGCRRGLQPSINEAASTHTRSELLTNDSGFSRHDSLLNFGVSSSRNAAELKSLLGNHNSRLKPGATVLSLHTSAMDKHTRQAHAVSLEQAKPRARVEVDIMLESDCIVEGGYMRGNIKLRVRKRHKKEAPVLLAEGKVRVIGFECIPGENNRHTFYQRARPLSAITDAYTGVYDSPPDTEGFSRAMEGVHVLPFAMHLPIDEPCGSAKGSVDLPDGVAIRYIAMISVKVKDSATGKRSIAHFYRNCQVWPRLNPSIVLASAPRPIQASTAKSLSVIGGGSKVKLTAMLHRMTWVAGQRCFVRIWIANETQKTVKTVSLTLVRTITLFKPRPHLDPGNRASVDPDACQTATTHRAVAETVLERGHHVAKGHASAEGWWTGVPADREAQFSNWILIPADALSIPRSRLLEVEYFIRVTASAGALTSDVHVTLPVRIVNFLSLDPTPSEPLLSPDGAYTRLIPYDNASEQGSSLRCATASHGNDTRCSTLTSIDGMPSSIDFVPSLGAPHPSTSRRHQQEALSTGQSSRIALDTPLCHLATSDKLPQRSLTSIRTEDDESAIASTSQSGSSMCSAASSSHSSESSLEDLGNLELDDEAGSDEEVDFVVGTAQIDRGRFPDSPDCRLEYASEGDMDVKETNVSGGRRCLVEARTDDEAYVSNPSTDPDPSTRQICTSRTTDSPVRAQHVMSATHDLVCNVPRGPRMAHTIQIGSTVSRERSSRLSTDRATFPGSTPPTSGIVYHVRERAGSDARADILEMDHIGDAVDYEGENDGATPRLGAAVASDVLFSSTGSQSTLVVGIVPKSRSELQRSRQLPLPPSTSHMAEIPASVSALEALRMSQFAPVQPNAPPACDGGPSSSARRTTLTSPTRLTVTAACEDPSSSRPTFGRSASETPSRAAGGRPQRPTHLLHTQAKSDGASVQGRIAALEERLRDCQQAGLAYV